MFSSGFLMSSGSSMNGSTMLMIVLLLIILDITIFIYSIYCLFDCVEKKGMKISTAVLLAVLHFVPGLGGFISIGIIIYHMLHCGKKGAVAPSYRFKH
jgi:hypothetical protein